MPSTSSIECVWPPPAFILATRPVCRGATAATSGRGHDVAGQTRPGVAVVLGQERRPRLLLRVGEVPPGLTTRELVRPPRRLVQ